MSRRIALLSLLLVGCPLPAIHTPDIPPPSAPAVVIPRSHFELPLELEANQLIQSANEQVPASRDAMGAWTALEPGDTPLAIKYRFSRNQDFALISHPGLILLRAIYSYEVHFAKRVKKPWPFSGYFWLELTGWNGQQAIDVASNVTINSQWEPAISMAVTGIPDQMKGQLQVNPEPIKAKLRERIGVERARLSQQWDKLSQPVQPNPQVPLWFSFRPRSFFLSSIYGDRGTLHTSFVLEAEPEVVLGQAPAAPAVPLPGPSAPQPLQHKLDVRILAGLTYANANIALRSLVGYKIHGNVFQQAEVKDIKVFGGDDGTIAIAIQVRGLVANGTIYLVGSLKYDDVAFKLYVPRKADDPKGLDFSVETSSALTAGLAWILHSDLLAKIQEKCAWNLADDIARQTQAIRQGFEQVSGGKATAENAVLQPGNISTNQAGFQLPIRYEATIVSH